MGIGGAALSPARLGEVDELARVAGIHPTPACVVDIHPTPACAVGEAAKIGEIAKRATLEKWQVDPKGLAR